MINLSKTTRQVQTVNIFFQNISTLTFRVFAFCILIFRLPNPQLLQESYTQ